MELFTEKHSIVRKIWGKSDTVLFVFAGSAAEFALNKAVDWLYYTGKLPADPIGRFFSTVGYARKIVFSSMADANAAIDMMKKIHSTVEQNRGATIPEWAYRDVLFMLIHYSIASHELLEEKLTDEEKEEVYNVFYRMGTRMGLQELPATYQDWLPVRESHLMNDLQKSKYTNDLFKQYRKHLGALRYNLLIGVQQLIVPKKVKGLLELSNLPVSQPLIIIYKITRLIKMDRILKNLLLPSEYKEQIKELDVY